MATINLRENRQVIDYLARDYNSFRQALIDLIPAKLPEWTDRSEADFGIVLIELFAYMADILSYYQDRVANEAFLNTAQERRSVINHLRLIGYEMAAAAPAAARLSVIVANSVNQTVEIRRGDQFATSSSKDRKSLTFEYTDDKPLVIDLSQLVPNSAKKPDGTPLKNFKEATAVIPVREGRSIVNEVIGISDGSPNQQYRLAQPRVLRDSIEIVVDTAPPTPPWKLRRHLIFSGRAFTPEQLAALEQQGRIGATLAFSRNADPDYTTETDENEVTRIIFGDGQYGQIPPPNARLIANYRVGGGAIGNVGAGQITVIARAPQLQLLGAKVNNPLPASGGDERESIDQAVKFAPTAFTSMQRAVTANDYVAQAKLFPGVSKARAEAGNWNMVNLYIAPTGKGEEPSDILQRDLLAYFEDKRMVTSLIRILSPTYVHIEIAVDVVAVPYFRNEVVRADAEKAIRDLLDFEKVDFKQTLYLSKIYEALENLDGVDHVFVRRFEPSDAALAPTHDGLIELRENQIAVLGLGDLQIDVQGGV
ncbi:MAG TPA: baseplate J/gp47 family protein [Blastocatellia bacterium]|nr:baseplate J/gp47 family protein [Blastocatellia bacterium]